MSAWLGTARLGLVKPELAREVISPPYDLYTPAQRLQHARAHPRNFMNGTLSEADDPDLNSSDRRDQATSYLQEELAAGTWRFEQNAVAVLRLASKGNVQTGVVGDVAHDAFPEMVRPHEHTRPDRVDDLAGYLRSVGYGSSPVGLTYRRRSEIDEIVAVITAQQPDLDVVLDDDDRATVWMIRPGPRRQSVLDELMAACSEIPATYIIDGHHRVAATVQRGADPRTPAGRFLAVAFPDDDLVVYPFHRWIDGTLDPPGRRFTASPEPLPGHAVAVTRDGDWQIDLEVRGDEEDVAALARTVLAPLMGVVDERTDRRIAFVPGFPDAERLREMVRLRGGVGFLLHPSTVEAVMAVSDRGGVMPPKATFFAPKPRSGLFLVER